MTFELLLFIRFDILLPGKMNLINLLYLKNISILMLIIDSLWVENCSTNKLVGLIEPRQTFTIKIISNYL